MKAAIIICWVMLKNRKEKQIRGALILGITTPTVDRDETRQAINGADPAFRRANLG